MKLLKQNTKNTYLTGSLLLGLLVLLGLFIFNLTTSITIIFFYLLIAFSLNSIISIDLIIDFIIHPDYLKKNRRTMLLIGINTIIIFLYTLIVLNHNFQSYL